MPACTSRWRARSAWCRPTPIVICAGQEPARSLYDELIARGVKAHVIGGAERAAELDALRAIDQGTRLAYTF